MNKKRISFIAFFSTIAILCLYCSVWQIRRYIDKKDLKMKIENLDFNKKQYSKISLSGMKEFDISNFTAKIISDKFATLKHYSTNKCNVWHEDILILAEIEGKKVIISLGAIDGWGKNENNFKNEDEVKKNIQNLSEITGNFILFQPKKRLFANDILEDTESFFPSNIMGLGSFSTFRKDYFERYWETDIDFSFALIDINPNSAYYLESTLLPNNIVIKLQHHIFYAGMWIFYSILALIYLILNNKKL